jgi:hypothetical protein
VLVHVCVQEHTPSGRLDDDLGKKILFGIRRSFHLPGRHAYACHYLEASDLVSIQVHGVSRSGSNISASPETSCPNKLPSISVPSYAERGERRIRL